MYSLKENYFVEDTKTNTYSVLSWIFIVLGILCMVVSATKDEPLDVY